MSSLFGRSRAWPAILLGLSTVACNACRGESWPGPTPATHESGVVPHPSMPSASGLGGAVPPSGDHPRIWLTKQRLERGRSLASSDPGWLAARATCEHAGQSAIASGYEGWDWANAMLSCALVYRVSGDADAARTGLRYLQAILDDREAVGDAQGGEHEVEHDSGYPIRTRGFLGAIGYDWLYDAPGMSRGLRERAAERFSAWAKWFAKKGYMRDEPIANYYAGYFGAVTMAAIALDEDAEGAAELREQAAQMFASEVRPAFGRLSGGGWPEGWQYGGLVAVVMSAYAQSDGEMKRRAGGDKDAAWRQMPWLKESVAFAVHGMHPDGVHMYDGGDWSEKPAELGEQGLYAVALAAPKGDVSGAHALYLAQQIKDHSKQWTWLRALAVTSEHRPKSPRGGPLSYLASGTGNVFGRTNWNSNAAWFAFQSGPHIGDHQHLDQGHFALVRESDELLVDGGGYGSGSSTSHNTLLIDDHTGKMTYPPNQTPNQTTAKVTAFEDAGDTIYARGDFASAYDPVHLPKGASGPVTRAQRDLLFVRPHAGDPPVLAVYDRVSLTSSKSDVTFALHAFGTVDTMANGFAVRRGRSQAIVTTIEPGSAKRKTLKEPASKNSDSFWYRNDPPRGLTSTRMEVASDPGSTERRFFHVVAAQPRTDRPLVGTRLTATSIDVAQIGALVVGAVGEPKKPPAVVRYEYGQNAKRHRLVGLGPRAGYAVTVRPQGRGKCLIELASGKGLTTSREGVLAFDSAACSVPKPKP